MPSNTTGRTQSDYESVYRRVKAKAPDYEMLLPSPEDLDILLSRHTPLDAQASQPVCEMILVHVLDDWYTGSPGANITKAIRLYTEKLSSVDQQPVAAVRKAAALLAWTYIRLDNDSDDARLLLNRVLETTPANDGGRTLPKLLREELETAASKDRWRHPTVPVHHIFEKTEVADVEFLLGNIESPINFTDDKELKSLHEAYQARPTADNKAALLGKLEREIRYLGSSDIAYLFRWVFSREAGVHISEVVDDVATKLKVRVPDVAGIETKLERISRNVLVRQFQQMTPEQQREHIDRLGVDRKLRDEVFQRLARDGAKYLIPILFRVLGKKFVTKFATNVVIEVVANIVGKQVATQLIKTLIKEFPWWAEWIGPIAWTATGAWLAVDLLGPAYRKTIPIVLYLGAVMLRDGPEEGDSFWQEPESAET